GGDDAVLGGTQLVAPVTAPVTAGGNAVSVLGTSAVVNSAAGASAPGGAATPGDVTTGGEGSAGGGTQVAAPVTTPITAAGNALAVLGGSTVTGAGIPSGTAPAAATPGDAVTGGNGAVLG